MAVQKGSILKISILANYEELGQLTSLLASRHSRILKIDVMKQESPKTEEPVRKKRRPIVTLEKARQVYKDPEKGLAKLADKYDLSNTVVHAILHKKGRYSSIDKGKLA